MKLVNNKPTVVPINGWSNMIEYIDRDVLCHVWHVRNAVSGVWEQIGLQVTREIDDAINKQT